MSQVVVRFAPSPTGTLHIGGVRTALFNYLFARHNGGKFLLRIEDTDRERSKPEFEEVILRDLAWLGLEWDGEPVHQTSRLARYQHYANELIQKELAYRVDTETQAVKFRMPDGDLKFHDLIRGDIRVHTRELDELVIIKSDGFPTYNFACFVDDHEMGLTHIIRGEDHITNTVKQIALYQALGLKLPEFAHLPLIIGSDQAPLSKRHGAVSVAAYREKGYLKEGLINYLAFLGWGPGHEREIFSKEELIREFSLERIGKTAATFDEVKLAWVNAHHLRALTDEAYLEGLSDYLKEGKQSALLERRDYFKSVALLYKDRVRTFADFYALASYCFTESVHFDPKAVEKRLKKEGVQANLKHLIERLAPLESFENEERVEEVVRTLAEELDIKAAQLIHPIRVAITGSAMSPSLFALMRVLGKEVVMKRLEYVAQHDLKALPNG